jgi:hypothetical protein
MNATGTIPLTGKVRDAAGNLFNGAIRLVLSYSASHHITLDDLVIAVEVTFPIQNGGLPANAKIVPNDMLTPANTTYTAQYLNPGGKIVGQNVFYISGNAFDLGSALPSPLTTSNISFAPVETAVLWQDITSTVTLNTGVELVVAGSDQGVTVLQQGTMLLVAFSISFHITVAVPAIEMTLPFPDAAFFTATNRVVGAGFVYQFGGPTRPGSVYSDANVISLYTDNYGNWPLAPPDIYAVGQIVVPLATSAPLF